MVDPLVTAQLQQLKHLDLSNNRIRDFKTIQILVFPLVELGHGNSSDSNFYPACNT